MFFSQRQKLEPVKTVVQLHDMDNDLRVALWNVFSQKVWVQIQPKHDWIGPPPEWFAPITALWERYFKEPLDTIPPDWNRLYGALREEYFRAPWNKAYDFIEIVATYVPFYARQSVMDAFNAALERELSGYRFVNGHIAPISEPEQIAAIEAAVQSSPLAATRKHINSAIDLLTKKPDPDFRNSIKESISAVEALCRAITGLPNATLGQALDKLQLEDIHPALRGALDKLYGYASNENGIRHSLLAGESKVSHEEALFMLVVASAFVNYLTAKAAKSGVRF